MKKIYILLTGLVILLGAFLWYQFGGSSDVSVPSPVAGSVASDVPLGSMENWNWVFSEVSAQGIQFMYPDPLPTTYVTADTWPPKVEMVAGDFECVVGSVVGAGDTPSLSAQRTIEGKEYCVSFVVEGAIGSTYTSYEYTTKQGDFISTVSFTLQKPQCLNYEDPKRTECQTEQLLLNVDQLADQILGSITMQ